MLKIVLRNDEGGREWAGVWLTGQAHTQSWVVPSTTENKGGREHKAVTFVKCLLHTWHEHDPMCSVIWPRQQLCEVGTVMVPILQIRKCSIDRSRKWLKAT